MSQVTEDGMLWKVEDMLQAAIESHEAEPATKAFVILLVDDDEGMYLPRWLNCKLRMTEVIALLEIVKLDCAVSLMSC